MSSGARIQNAVLVAIQLPRVTPEEVEGSLRELERLVTTLGYNVVGQVTQKRSSEKGATVLGEGKLTELAQWTDGTGVIGKGFQKKKTKAEVRRDEEALAEAELSSALGTAEGEEADAPEDLVSAVLAEHKGSAQIVIFDCDLSPSQLRNLESATGVPVLDRTGVIIEIFGRHARTRAARLQVEIAKLAYLAPRLRETGGSTERQGGKGAGETSLELDKRRVRDRIKELKQELASVGNEHEVRRARRDQENCVALVGYTNAGKSSLMRALTGSEVLVADKLFATLDTTIRPLHPESQPKVLVSDTVGFIKKLPHDLVASFKSTLDEALNASLLLFVVDGSDPSFRAQYEVTKTVLGEVGATDVPSLLILNKRDRLNDEDRVKLQREFPDAIFLSTRDKKDVQMLREKILSYFEEDMVDEELLIPYTAKGVIGEVRSRMRVLSESYGEGGTLFRVRSTPENISQIRKKLQAR